MQNLFRLNTARVTHLVGFALLPIILSACGGDDDNDAPTAEFSVTVLNTTHNQPLSPVATILHSPGYLAWSIGEPASDGLEELAESGDPEAFLSEASDALGSVAADGITAPGENATLTLSARHAADLEITVATMLVNTNDAFAGTNGIRVGHLAVGETTSMRAPVYDAGTEANDETAATVPGPAGGGEGFNTARESRDQVTRHPGVVTQSDGYADSALDQSHRFDNGALLIRIERTR